MEHEKGEHSRSWSHTDRAVSPHSPAGGGGPGRFRGTASPHQTYGPPAPAHAHRADRSSTGGTVVNAAVHAGSLEVLKKAAETYFGALSFEVGVYSGMLENLGASAAAMVELGKMFYLAGLYDAALLPPHLAVGPLSLLRIEGLLALLLFRRQLKEAHDQRDKLMAELKGAVVNLGPFLAEAKKKYSKEYVEKWDRFQTLLGKSGISDRFEAGRILGGVLMDVILMVLTVIDIAAGAVAAARYLAKIPELVRIARGMEGMEGLLAVKRGAAGAQKVEEVTGAGTMARDLEATHANAPAEQPKASSASAVKDTAPAEPALPPRQYTGDPFDYYMKRVETLNVSTESGEAVFYSGKGNRALAEAFAKTNGKTTLEMTPGGKWLDGQRLFSPDSPLSPDQAYKVWCRMSERYAQGASGSVVGFVEGADPGRIFNTVEYKALQSNPNITNVITGGH